MSRLFDALQRAHALREETRDAGQAPAVAPAPASELAEPPMLEDELPQPDLPQVQAPHRESGTVRVAITAVAGLLLAALFAWFLATSHAARERPAAKPGSLKLDYQLPPKK